MLRKISLASLSLAFVLLIFFACYVNLLVPKPVMEEQDIYYSYVEGNRLVKGENPYARILESDMSRNKKYPTYFPVFYELSYVSQMLGLRSFIDWMAVWRIVFMVFEFAIAALLYVVLARRNLAWAGVFAAAFWLFNRWTLNMVGTENLDFIPIFLLLASLELFPRKKGLSLFLFSLSLGFKQIAIFLAPLYLIWVFRSAGKDWLKQVLKSAAMIASVPLLSSLPFLVWDAKGFILSVLFSADRAGNTFGGLSLDTIMGWNGLPARFAMLALMAMVYVIALQGSLKKYLLSFWVMLVFVCFNTVLFAQYLVWTLPLLLLLLCDFQNPAPGNLTDRATLESAALPKT